MREGWTYKKMSEVFDLQMGKTPDRKTPSYFGGNNVWVSIRDLDGKEIGESNEHITDTAVTTTNIRKVKKGTVIMSFKLTVGKCAICTKDLYTNEAIMAFNLKEGYDITPDFLYYYLSNYNWKGANKAVMGMTLNKATISQQIISYPSLSEQQSIVAELDKINELISLKKAQLSDLDSLAQSIFYDMFGDPIENEKGWEVKKLGEMCTCITKGTTPTTLGFSFTDTGVNFVKVESFIDGQINNAKLAHITNECNMALSRSQLQNKDLLICIAGATIGKMAVVDSSILPANTNQACAIVRLRNKNHLRFIRTFIAIKLKEDIIQMGKGVAQPNLSLGQLREFLISVPPLPLQQEFAKRIKMIEQQKAQIGSTIKDLETLLASRMQYWFD